MLLTQSMHFMLRVPTLTHHYFTNGSVATLRIGKGVLLPSPKECCCRRRRHHRRIVRLLPSLPSSPKECCCRRRRHRRIVAVVVCCRRRRVAVVVALLLPK
jgi:hypothetical protein